MRRGASEQWTLRFWFNAPAKALADIGLGARRQECNRIVRDIMVLMITDRPSTVDGADEIVQQILDSFVNHGCAAYEIINADTGDGDVVYLEWP